MYMDSADTTPQGDDSTPRYTQEIYYKFRFTFPFQDASTIAEEPRGTAKHQVSKITRWITELLVPKYTTEGTFGLEYLNSRGDPTYIHFHFHFKSKYSRDTIAKALFRKLDEGSFTFKGPKVFSLKPEPYVEADKFFRYPLKQLVKDSPNCKWSFERCTGFTPERLEELRHVANEQWKISSEISRTKSDKNTTQDTLFERLFSIVKKDMETKKVSPPPLKYFKQHVLRFYVSEDRPLNFSVMSGYSYLLAFKCNSISEEEMLDKF